MSYDRNFGTITVHLGQFKYAFKLKCESAADYEVLMLGAEKISHEEAMTKMMGLDGHEIDHSFSLGLWNGEPCYFAEHGGVVEVWLKFPQHVSGVVTV